MSLTKSVKEVGISTNHINSMCIETYDLGIANLGPQNETIAVCYFL